MRFAVLASVALVLLALNPSAHLGISSLCLGAAGASVHILIKRNVD